VAFFAEGSFQEMVRFDFSPCLFSQTRLKKTNAHHRTPGSGVSQQLT